MVLYHRVPLAFDPAYSYIYHDLYQILAESIERHKNYIDMVVKVVDHSGRLGHTFQSPIPI